MKLPTFITGVNPFYVLALIIVLAGSNIYTLKKWWTADARCLASAANQANTQAATDIRRANVRNNQEFKAGEDARSNNNATFTPIKEKVYVPIKVPAACDQPVPDSVQHAVREAVDAANQR